MISITQRLLNLGIKYPNSRTVFEVAANEIEYLRDQVNRHQKKIEALQFFYLQKIKELVNEKEDLKNFQELDSEEDTGYVDIVNDYVLDDIEHLARKLHQKLESTVSYYSDPWGQDIRHLAQWIEILARKMKTSS